MTKTYDGFSTHVTGISGFGKSYFAKQVFIPLLVKFKPVIIFDYKGEYAGPRAVDADKSWNSYESISGFFEMLQSKGKIAQQVHVIQSRNNDDFIRGLAFFEHIRAQVSIILDEAQFIFLDGALQSAKKNLVRMVRAGRADGTDVIMISQRTMDMPPDIRSQFTRRITFRQNHQADVDVMYNDNGFTEAEKVRDLPKRKYMILGEFPDHLNMQKLK